MVAAGRKVHVAMRRTTKDSFLGDPDVEELSKWIAAHFRPSSGWEHSYVNRKTDDGWSCCGLADAFGQYSWRGKSWRETTERLDRLRHDLRSAVKRRNTEDAVAVCEKVLRWGGVSAHNVRRLRSRKHVLIAELGHMRCVLARNHTPSRRDMLIQTAGPATECRMNAGFVKIYSLLCEYCVMYDGRVGAALGLLVRQFCDDTLRLEVPPPLAFAFGSAREGSNPKNPKIRNPSRGALRFPKLRQDSRFHTDSTRNTSCEPTGSCVARWKTTRGLSVRGRTDFTNWRRVCSWSAMTLGRRAYAPGGDDGADSPGCSDAGCPRRPHLSTLAHVNQPLSDSTRKASSICRWENCFFLSFHA